jgi:signal peptidase I
VASPEMQTAETQNALSQPARASASSARVPPSPYLAHRTGSIADYIESLLVTVLIALFGTTFVVQAFKIPSQSMEPTLLVGDHLLVNKFIFGGRGAWYEKILPYRPIERGDIIVFKFPYDDHPHYVKRVIGIPGDRIRISNQRVYINGSPVSEPYVVHDPAARDPFGESFPPADPYLVAGGLRPEWAIRIGNYVHNHELVVPAKHYFVMGDNRDNSWDSRNWGFVDVDAVMGRPMVIYWSVQASADDYTNEGLSGTLQGIFGALLHLPTRTRWHRMLREVH